jgi:hypothetical protein
MFLTKADNLDKDPNTPSLIDDEVSVRVCVRLRECVHLYIDMYGCVLLFLCLCVTS